MMRHGMGVTVEIYHRRTSKRISMSMGEYKEFIKEEAVNLGLITEEPREIKGFTMELEAVEIPKELMDMIMATKPSEENTCPRCENEEIDDDANFCIICGLPVERKEKVNDGE